MNALIISSLLTPRPLQKRAETTQPVNSTLPGVGGAAQGQQVASKTPPRPGVGGLIPQKTAPGTTNMPSVTTAQAETLAQPHNTGYAKAPNWWSNELANTFLWGTGMANTMFGVPSLAKPPLSDPNDMVPGGTYGNGPHQYIPEQFLAARAAAEHGQRMKALHPYQPGLSYGAGMTPQVVNALQGIMPA